MTRSDLKRNCLVGVILAISAVVTRSVTLAQHVSTDEMNQNANRHPLGRYFFIKDEDQ